MATGTIKQTDTSTTGIITVIDNGGNSAVANGSDLNYMDMDLPSKGGAGQNDVVIFDLVLVGREYQAAYVSRAMATGKIKETDTSTTGIITVSDNGGFANVANGSDINYLDADLPSNGGVTAGNTVSFTFVQSGRSYAAANIKKMVSVPADKGTVKTGTVTGNLSVDGIVVTLKGATVTGNVQVKNGGEILIKPDDSGVKTTLKKGLTANKNSIITLYESEITGTVAVTNCLSFSATGGSIGSSLVIVNATSGVTVDGTSIDGDAVVNNNAPTTVVKNCNITGNLEMHNNTGCGQTDNTVGGTNSGCA
jgi:hypothetical protein